MDVLLSALFLYLVAAASKTTAQVSPPSVSSSALSHAGSADGTASLNNQALAGFTNSSQFHTSASSQNSASGNSNTIGSQTSISSYSGPPDFVLDASYVQLNTHSQGNGLTGAFQNLDRTNSTSGAGGGGSDGLTTSQINGTGTGLSLLSSLNANAYANWAVTSTTSRPCCTTVCCGGECYCPCGCCSGVAQCAVSGPASAKGGSAVRSHKEATRNIKSKSLEKTVVKKSERKSYVPVVRHDLRGASRTIRSLLFANRY